jgi:hypothetical protein
MFVIVSRFWRCDVLRVFANTNFIACIMSALCVVASGACGALLPSHYPTRSAAGELLPSLAAFRQQPMCLALLIAMNVFLFVASPPHLQPLP